MYEGCMSHFLLLKTINEMTLTSEKVRWS